MGNIAHLAGDAYLECSIQRSDAMLKGLGNLGDMAKMMKAATEMQGKMAELQDQLARTVVIGESGAGLVKARATAKGEITGLDIDASILVPTEKEVLEDLILAAIKDAQSRGQQRNVDEMRKLTEALGLPSNMPLPF
jgi:DNA-binding YbaB/EbfC family protein